MFGLPKVPNIWANITTKFFDGLAWILPTSSVDGAIAALSRFSAALERAEQAQIAKSQRLFASSNRLTTAAKDAAEAAGAAHAESMRAARVRKNLATLTA